MATKRRQRLGTYPNLQQHRESLGWSIGTLRSKLDTTLSEKTLSRLESGYGVRVENAHMVFNAINRDHPDDLDRANEIVEIVR